MDPRTRRVAVVDDDTVVREGLRVLLSTVDVVGAYGSHGQLLDAAPGVDVVVLDLNLDGLGTGGVRHGANAVADVAAAGYRVLIYTNEHRLAVLAGCLSAGASGIVHKTEPLERLSESVHAVHRGEIVITSALVGLAELAQRQGALPSLSPRQCQVLRGRSRGESYRRIARRLDISEKVAHEYMSIVTARFAQFLRDHSAADLERHLGLGPGDLLDFDG
ncbi:response regulator [Dactylosporangium sp. CA-233914]|uniref:response regulator n=1 Tax=Dactylosporangium sp. CA-233914 TaxID=3239934 RepID=UPI003D910670